MRRGHHCGEFPVAEMRGEAQRRLAVVVQVEEELGIIGDDAAGVGVGHVVVPQAGRDARTRRRRGPGCPRRRAASLRSSRRPCRETPRAGWRDRCDARAAADPTAAPSRRTCRRRGRGRCGGGRQQVLHQAAEQPVAVEARGGVRSDAAQSLDKDLPEHVAAFQPRETGTEILQRIHRVDHRPHAGCDALQRAPKCAQRRAERADDAVLLLEQLHQVDAAGRSRCRAAGHQPAAALQR